VMERADVRFPLYGFARHKGYGTVAHYRALERYGPSPIHRKTFRLKISHRSHS
jgi:ribonuclease HII